MESARVLRNSLAALLGLAASANAYTVTTFAPGVYDPNTAAMDAALGISGMAIEDFSDTTLMTGLTIEFVDPAGGPFSTLPASFSNSVLAAEAWDGMPVLINHPTQALAALGGAYSDTIFHIAGGTQRFGVGLGDAQTYLSESQLFVNGTSLGLLSALPNYVDGPNPSTPSPMPTRNLFLIITAEPGDAAISSVTFDNLAPGLDAILFDHVAIDAVPEPAVALLLGAGLAAAALRRRQRR